MLMDGDNPYSEAGALNRDITDALAILTLAVLGANLTPSDITELKTMLARFVKLQMGKVPPDYAAIGRIERAMRLLADRYVDDG